MEAKISYIEFKQNICHSTEKKHMHIDHNQHQPLEVAFSFGCICPTVSSEAFRQVRISFEPLDIRSRTSDRLTLLTE